MRWIALPLMCVAIAGLVATAATARTDGPKLIVAQTAPTAPFATGTEDRSFIGPDATTAYAMARQDGATYVRLMVSWASIAPKALPASGFLPTDPASPYYQWSALDASISEAEAAGITPILDIVSPPPWGYATPPAPGMGGSPKLAELRAFATAIATRYDGSGPAPAAHIFSVWNEPNYNKNLYPRNPNLYRAMVNTVADAVHGVNPSNLMLAGELAPVRHLAHTHATTPLDWMRAMLCISTKLPIHRTCTTQTKFDVWTHHPYSDTGPYGKSRASGGVELGDLPQMEKLLHTAERLGAIASAQPVQFWVTEFGWSSNPPNPHGVPMLLEARWVSEAMYQMWKSGVSLGIWFALQDRGPGAPFQSGLYLRSTSLADAQAKPLVAAFRFPFVAYRKRSGVVQVWGRDPTSDLQNVTIQEQVTGSGKWTPVATVTSNTYGMFRTNLALHASPVGRLRANVPGPVTSAPFALWVPNNENMNVTPFPHN